MTKSTNIAEVVEVKLENHPNADSLSIVKIFGGYTVCVNTAAWTGIHLGVYITPDSIVDVEKEEFKFLADGKHQFHRVTVKKLRGVYSQGLLIPAPEGSVVGDDVTEQLGVGHYEPQNSVEFSTSTDSCSAPEGLSNLFKYDLDSARRYSHLFNVGEILYCTEKTEGENSRFVFTNDKMYCGSRNQWKKDDEKNLTWRAFRNTPSIEKFCEANKGFVLYGEVYGQVKGFKYDCASGEVKFRAFDIMRPDFTFLDARDFLDQCQNYGIPTVPFLGFIEYESFDQIAALAEGQSTIEGAKNVREGVVVKPMVERVDMRVGRVALKIVGNNYLSVK